MELLFFSLWVPALILTLGVVVGIVLPLFAVFLTFALPILLLLGFILLLWAISENIALSILIVSAIILVNLIVHSEKVKAFREKRL
ncbi:hypothetical protein [Actinobacillus porcinus]|uniref:hypothetical protein n=1 Tax=Actinobacillus porcinus TaxID=51048 RepID=UPI002A91B6CE|nr:hypothetical protein [Actinobacillus porcinus]MDY6215272.1 hypothetical protein [Actinobacillus porcinus]